MYSSETFLIIILTLFFFFLKEIEALLSDAGLDHYPEMVPNRQVTRN